jgi:hypothetical protein
VPSSSYFIFILDYGLPFSSSFHIFPLFLSLQLFFISSGIIIFPPPSSWSSFSLSLNVVEGMWAQRCRMLRIIWGSLPSLIGAAERCIDTQGRKICAFLIREFFLGFTSRQHHTVCHNANLREFRAVNSRRHEDGGRLTRRRHVFLIQGTGLLCDHSEKRKGAVNIFNNLMCILQLAMETS